MSATVYGVARHGATDDSSATGLLVGDYSVDNNIETGFAKNHIGEDVAMSLFNDKSETTCSGVVASKTVGLIVDLGDAITFANASADSLNTNTQNLMNAAVSNTANVITSVSLKRVNSDFETGDIKTIFNPLIATNAPVTIS
jgi:hypothetical protein